MAGREDEVEDSEENDPAKSANRRPLNPNKLAAPQAGPEGQIILPEDGTLCKEGDSADGYALQFLLAFLPGCISL
jgi:hypothetical protein